METKIFTNPGGRISEMYCFQKTWENTRYFYFSLDFFGIINDKDLHWIDKDGSKNKNIVFSHSGIRQKTLHSEQDVREERMN